MTFLNPILLGVGAACVAIPILIHLLMRRRRKPVLWAAMRFVLEAFKQQRKRLRLEQFLLLAARCLLVVLIAMALARPIIGRAAGLAGRPAVTVYLLVDDSLAASARDGTGPQAALDRHKAAAADVLKGIDPGAGDRVGLISLGGPAHAVVVPASSDAAAVGDLVKELTPTDSAADLPGAIAILKSVLATQEPSGRTIVVVLSDFLAGSADIERKLGEIGGGGVSVMATQPAPSGPDNVTITGVSPLRPVLVGTPGQATLRAPARVALRRTGPGVGSAAATTVRVSIQHPDDPVARVAGQAAVRWLPGQSNARAAIDLEVPTGESGSVVLTATIDDDAITGDNTFRRAIEVRQALRLGVVAPRRLGAGPRPGIQQFEAADWFRVALDPALGDRPIGGRENREIELIDVEPASVDAARLAGLDGAIVVRPEALSGAGWRHLRDMADAGGLVVVTPPTGSAVHLWADAMVRSLGLDWTVARESRIYAEPAAVAADPDRASRLPEGRDLLAIVAPELAELVRPVHVSQVLPVEAPAGGASTVLLALEDGTPLLIASRPGIKSEEPEVGPPGRGLIVFLASPPSFEWTDLQARPLMVPLMQEVARMGIARARGAWEGIAGAPLEAPARAVELRLDSGRSVPVAGSLASEPVRHAGVFRALDERGGLRGVVAVNADPAGGRTDAQAPSAVMSWLASSGAPAEWIEPLAVSEASTGHGEALRAALDRGHDSGPWALILLIGALSIAVVELALARWFSHAYAPLPTAAEGAAP